MKSAIAGAKTRCTFCTFGRARTLTAVSERCETSRTIRCVFRERCQRNESEHSSRSVGGKTQVGEIAREGGRRNVRKRDKSSLLF